MHLCHSEVYSAIFFHKCKGIKDFVLKTGELYFRGSAGVLARAISQVEAKMELERIHDFYYGDNDIGLRRRLQRRGSY